MEVFVGLLLLFVVVGLVESLKTKWPNAGLYLAGGYVALLIVGVLYLLVSGEGSGRYVDPDVAQEEYCTPPIAC